jgi:AcrR family transcriptional regulator
VRPAADPGLSPKAAQTRTTIADAALALFAERGYEATTMRAVAERAGVSTGNAYYYFSSKEELILEFYAINQAAHLAACRGVLDTETSLAGRLSGTIRALVDVLMPYHGFAAALYKHAAEPRSPLSPFSPESSPAREGAIAIYREVIEGSTARVGRDLAERLPELLWLYSLGIVLHWVYDSSPGCARTYRLIDVTVPVIRRLVGAARLPVLRATAADITKIVDQVRG